MLRPNVDRALFTKFLLTQPRCSLLRLQFQSFCLKIIPVAALARCGVPPRISHGTVGLAQIARLCSTDSAALAVSPRRTCSPRALLLLASSLACSSNASHFSVNAALQPQSIHEWLDERIEFHEGIFHELARPFLERSACVLPQKNTKVASVGDSRSILAIWLRGAACSTHCADRSECCEIAV
jgi:hypothetical protein